MNSIPFFRSGLRGIGLLFLQVLVLENIVPGGGFLDYVSIILYPLFIMLLPVQLSQVLVIILGFIMGISVDLFTDTLGVHAAACVITAYVRGPVLGFMEPRIGYNVNQSPTIQNFGFSWFLSYASILMFIHLFSFFSIETFTFVFFVDIFLKTVFSFIISMIFVVMYSLVFSPQN